jgi:hypothetical protein
MLRKASQGVTLQHGRFTLRVPEIPRGRLGRHHQALVRYPFIYQHTR